MSHPLLELLNRPRVWVLCLALLFLVSCAGDRSRYMGSSIPYSVQRVSVVSAYPSTDQFASELHYHLQNSVGRPRGSHGKPIDLVVQVLPNGVFNQSVRSIFSKVKTIGAASLTANVRLVDHRTGASLGYKQVVGRSTSNMSQVANSKIAEDMIAEIRLMLDLGLTAPHPIANRVTANNGFPRGQNGFVPSSAYNGGMYNGDAVQDNGFRLTDTDGVLLQRIQEIDSAMTADAQEMRNYVNRERQNLAENGSSQEETMAEEQTVTEPSTDVVDAQDEAQAIIDNFTVGASSTPDFVTEPIVNPLDSPLSSDNTATDLCIVTAENDCLGAQ